MRMEEKQTIMDIIKKQIRLLNKSLDTARKEYDDKIKEIETARKHIQAGCSHEKTGYFWGAISEDSYIQCEICGKIL